MLNKFIECACLAGMMMTSQFSNAQSASAAGSGNVPESEVWTFDQTTSLGGHTVTVLGHPHVIESPYGKAVEFNGVDDALFVGVHPLAGASAFTWELIFRPDADGAEEQRFFHLQEQNPVTGADTDNRMLFELRIVNGQWCLDSFAITAGEKLTLLDRTRLHPLGKWYRVAAVYDGREFRNYVDGELQGAGALKLGPQGAGHSSVGVRINKRDYFKGAILMARMTKRALLPEQFLKFPAANRSGKNR
jgi:hypothetical protein